MDIEGSGRRKIKLNEDQLMDMGSVRRNSAFNVEAGKLGMALIVWFPKT
jgi:hypothetical protein